MFKLTTLFVFLYLIISQVLVAQIDNNCTVNQYNTKITVTRTGLIENVQVALLVLNRTGDCYSSIRIPFSKIEPINLTMAQIETPDGSVIRKLKSKEIVEKSDISSFSLYEDRMIYEFDLRHNIYPYVVKYEYTRKIINYIEICDWTPMYHPDLKTIQASLSIETPASKELNVYTDQIGDAAINRSQSDVSISTWTSCYTPFVKEQFAPNKYNTLPRVIVTMPDFFYGIDGNISSWASFGQWYAQLTRGLDKLTPEEKVTIDQIKAQTTSNTQLIELLYKHLQTSKRYINVSTKIGGIKPHPASYVCTNGYGDCKALSNYMRAVLKYVGIESNLALVYSNEKPIHVPASFPCDKFNHVILCVPNQGDTLWLECTSHFFPAGYLGESTQNRYALLIDDANSKLVRTPKLTPQQCQVIKRCRIAQGGETNYHITFNGPSFEEVKGIDNGLSQQWHEYVLDHYLMPSFDAREWTFTQPGSDIPQIDLTIKGNWGLSKEVQPQASQIFLSIPSMPFPQLPKNVNRQTPVHFPYPTWIVDTTWIETPVAFKKLENNSSVNIEGEFATYSRSLEQEGKHLRIVRQMMIPEGTYPTKVYADIVALFQMIAKVDKERIALSK